MLLFPLYVLELLTPYSVNQTNANPTKSYTGGAEFIKMQNVS